MNTMNWLNFFIIILFLVLPMEALGNGGPVDWTRASSAGDIRPQQQQSVTLNEEHLKISLHLKEYTVTASYKLVSETSKKVKFGVPMIWLKYQFENEEIPKLPQDYKKIKLQLNGKNVGCKPKLSKEPTELSSHPIPGLYNSKPAPVPARAWCLADLNFVKGENVLKMNYSASYWFEDYEFSKSPITEFSSRVLYYPFSPAGFWKGLISKIKIELDLGPYRHLQSVHLSPFKLESQGQHLTGIGRNLDLKMISPLVLSLNPDPAAKNQLIHWNSLKDKDYSRIMAEPNASSTLKGNYRAKNLMDGDPDTAWCEGKPGHGIGEWVEFYIPKDAKQYVTCRYYGVALTQGYLKQQTTFENNGRLKEVRLTECGEEEPFATAHFNDTQRHDLAVDVIKIQNYQNPQVLRFMNKIRDDQPVCLRLTIDKVYKGKKFEDTCISEVAILLNCG